MGTGSATFVAATGLSPSTTLAFAPDGTLYGVNRSNNNLYTINTATAVPTLIGGLGIGSTTGGALTVTGDGQLWFVRGSPSTLFRVDRTTGAATSVGAIGVSVTGLAGTCGGKLYGYSPGEPGQLIEINPTTGAGSVIGSTGQTETAYLAFDTSETLVATTNGDQNTLALSHTCAAPQPAPQVVTGPSFTG